MSRQITRVISKISILATVLAMILVGFVSPVEASHQMVAQGSFNTLSDTFTWLRTLGDASYYHEALSLVYFGDLAGSAVDSDLFIQYADGSFTGQGWEYCQSCTIGGRTGSFYAWFNFSGSGLPYTGTLTFTRGSGGLEGLQGGGSFGGDAQGNQTYSYRYSFNSDR